MSSNSNNNFGKKEEALIENIQTGQFHAFYGSKNSHFKNLTIANKERS